MKRRLLNILSAMFFPLLCLATGALWITSYRLHHLSTLRFIFVIFYGPLDRGVADCPSKHEPPSFQHPRGIVAVAVRGNGDRCENNGLRLPSRIRSGSGVCEDNTGAPMGIRAPNSDSTRPMVCFRGKRGEEATTPEARFVHHLRLRPASQQRPLPRMRSHPFRFRRQARRCSPPPPKD